MELADKAAEIRRRTRNRTIDRPECQRLDYDRIIFSNGSMDRAFRLCSSATASRRYLIGVTRQLIGVAGSPFSYRGSIGPWPIDERPGRSATGWETHRWFGFGLVGWFGVDYVLHDGVPWPVEINPRYTASVEIHELASASIAVRRASPCLRRELSVNRRPSRSTPACRPPRIIAKMDPVCLAER